MIQIVRRAKRIIKRHLHEVEHLEFSIRRNEMINHALHSKESGITSEALCDVEVIVSLTTFGNRLLEVAPAIESIMQGSMKPNRIMLWLKEEMKGVTFPIAIRRQQERGLEVFFCKDFRSYKKLIPTLCKYPNAGIITIDDDCVYDYDLVEKLVNAHIRYPKEIIANRMHRIIIGKDGRPVSYMDWEWNASPDIEEASHRLFLTGVGGAFYPPNTLHPEVVNDEVFMDICKYADDVWFNAMALMMGTKVRKCYTHNFKGEDYVNNEDAQFFALSKINTIRGRCENDAQMKAVFEHYQLWDKLLQD